MEMQNGLPALLDKVRSLASIHRKSGQMLEAASTAALTAGFTPEQINDAAGEEYPPVGANPEWLKGYEAAAEGRVVAPATSNEYEGYMAWLRRHG